MAGNISVNSLLSQATSAYNTMQSITDAQKAQEWANGPQDQASYEDYTSYLQGRAKTLASAGTPADLSKAQSLYTAENGAFKTFTSNKIQQKTLDIYNGSATAEDKLATIKSGAEAAYANGDAQLGQQLETMYDSEYNTLQNQQAAAGAQAQSDEAHYYNDQAKQFKEAMGQLQDSTNAGKNFFGDAKTNPDYGKTLLPSQLLNMYQTLTTNHLAMLQQAGSDPGLSQDAQATFQGQAADAQKSYEADPVVNGQIANDLKNNQSALLETVKNGIKSFIQNPNMVGQKAVQQPDGSYQLVNEYSLNKSTASINTELKSSGKSTFTAIENGTPFQHQIFLSNPNDPNSSAYYFNSNGYKEFYNRNTGTHQSFNTISTDANGNAVVDKSGNPVPIAGKQNANTPPANNVQGPANKVGAPTSNGQVQSAVNIFGNPNINKVPGVGKSTGTSSALPQLGKNAASDLFGGLPSNVSQILNGSNKVLAPAASAAKPSGAFNALVTQVTGNAKGAVPLQPATPAATPQPTQAQAASAIPAKNFVPNPTPNTVANVTSTVGKPGAVLSGLHSLGG